MYKNTKEMQNSIEYSSTLYQTYTPIFVYKHKPKSEPPHRQHMVHPRPQAQEDSVDKPGTHLLIVLSLTSPRFLPRKTVSRFDKNHA